MEAVEGSARVPILIQDSDSDSDSTTSESLPSSPTELTECIWRTRQFHTYQCSRYFDCPAHTIERADFDNVDQQANGVASQNQAHDTSVLGAAASRISSSVPSRIEPSQDSSDRGAQLIEGGLDSSAVSLGGNTSEQAGTSSGVANTGGVRSRGDGRDVSSQGPGLLSDANLIRIREENLLATAFNDARSNSTGPISAPQDMGSSPLPPSNPLPLRTLPPTPPRPPPIDRAGLTWRPSISPLPTGRTNASGRSTVEPSEMVLPRWQPDAEVTYCPICHTQFSIFVRKHHCRKCGRVVCNSCSPHRITIPYQYIVQPPGAPPLSQRHASFMGANIGYGEFSTLAGGERVRLCNPCVPDPNTAPPQTQDSPTWRHTRSQSTLAGANASTRRYGTYFPLPQPTDFAARSRSSTLATGVTHIPRSGHGQAQYLSTQSRIMAGTPPIYYPQPTSVPSGQFPGGPVTPFVGDPLAQFRSLLDVQGGASQWRRSVASPPIQGPARLRPPQPPQPQPLAEEDECPVCHRELPSRTLPDFESRREAHISSCITSHSRYSGGAGNEGGSPTNADEGSSSGPPRRTGMFPYVATEKDCVDSAECTICLEEFEVGVPMARLECLCRFHRGCIDAWFVNHFGRCPVHQHDSFGY